MSDEQREDEEAEVEAHSLPPAVNIGSAADGESEDDEVEAHVRKANVRMDSPRHI